MSDFIFENKLIYEKSPYLLNHAHNPVNWFPWGKEAFSLSKEQNKLIFLSIGGISPSWHSLIFEEVFNKENIASFMNFNFVNIKMDKEEYPHLAHLYLDFSKILLSGSLSKNNWPINIILTPDLFPFFSVHYFSIEENASMIGIFELLEKIVSLWEDSTTREHMVMQSHKMLEVLSLVEKSLDNNSCFLNMQDFIYLIYKEIDLINGGIKSFPKYLNVNLLKCLLHFSVEHYDNKSLFFVNRSLDFMSRGSIFDHIRGGFYRYAIDDSWLLPSLEKLSTENAALCLFFLEMYSLTQEEDYKRIALLILNYLVDNLRDPDTHLFYLSESANFEGAASFSHTCSYEEIQSLFKEDGNLFCEYFSVHKEGIFDGRNILKRPTNNSEELLISKKYNLRLSELKEKVNGLLNLLKTFKEKNVLGTCKNTQNIVYANGFIAYSLIQAGLLLGDMHYIDISEEIIVFIKKNMYKDDLLLRICENNQNKIIGCLEDYAAIILASIALFEAGRGSQWLSFACSLMNVVKTHFRTEQGGFYSNHDQDTHVILRRCNFIDTAIPSENSLIAEALVKLYFLFDDQLFLDEAMFVLEKAKIQMKMDIVSCSSYLTIFLKLNVKNLLKLVILLDANHSYKHELECLFINLYFPNKIVIWLKEEEMQKTSLFPKKLNLKLVKEKTTMFLFEEDKTSRFIDPNKLREYLNNL